VTFRDRLIATIRAARLEKLVTDRTGVTAVQERRLRELRSRVLPRVILCVPRERVAAIASARPLAVRLSAEVLSAEFLALVPFELEAGTVR